MTVTSYTNVRLWDGKSDTYSNHEAITVDGDRIVSLSADRKNGVDCNGLTAIPGLMDAHVHMTIDPDIRGTAEQMALPSDQVRLAMAERARRMVQAGITTARDLGGGKWLEIELRERILRGEIPGPRLQCAGQPVTSVKGHCWFWGGEVATEQDAVDVIDRQKRRGADLIKIMATGGKLTKSTNPGVAQFSTRELEHIVAAAEERGMRTAAHCHGTAGIGNAAAACVTTIEHCSWMDENQDRSAFDEDIAACIGRNGCFVSPTIYDKWTGIWNKSDNFAAMIQNQFRVMREHGVRLIASTDAGIPDVHHHDLAKALLEFKFYADLTPVETLRAATSTCAEALGISDDVGTIESGKCADLLFVEGDPLSDLTVLQSPVRVVVRGIEQNLSHR